MSKDEGDELSGKVEDLSIETLEQVNAELDEMAVRNLSLMKQYIDCKLNIEDHMKSGSMNLAKARYIMGNRSVSVLQLPSEESFDLEAQTTLLSLNHKSGSFENISYVLQREAESVNGTTLKSRGAAKDEGGDINLDDSPRRKTANKDPLKWFGVLVPQNLRQGQASFNKALDHVVDCVNVQLEMDALWKRYHRYLAKKRKLMASQSSDK